MTTMTEFERMLKQIAFRTAKRSLTWENRTPEAKERMIMEIFGELKLMKRRIERAGFTFEIKAQEKETSHE